MSYVKAKWNNSGPGTSTYNPTLSIEGQLFHLLVPARQSSGIEPGFLEVYFHDSDAAAQAEQRHSHNRSLDPVILEEISNFLQQNNKYVQSFNCLREWVTAEKPPTEYIMVIHADRRPAREHTRRYNAPETSEGAAIIPGTEDRLFNRHRDTIVQRRGRLNSAGNDNLEEVSLENRAYDGFGYPLFLLFGEDGWHHEMRMYNPRNPNRGRITVRKFYVSKFLTPPSELKLILWGRQLYQQYSIDMWI